jgi:HEAT repeat protein
MKKILSLLLVFMLAGVLLYAQEEKTAEDYVNDLSSNNPSLIVEACNWLGENNNKDGVEKMIDLLSHENDEVRMWSAANLGLLGEDTAFDPILDSLVRESNSDVRYTMVLSLTRIGVTTEEQKDKINELKGLETNPIIKDYITKMDEKYNGAEEEEPAEEGTSSSSGETPPAE